MSYSFEVRAANKALAKLGVSAELDKVAAGQPSHARDRVQAQAAADTFIELLDEDEGRDVKVVMSGSLSGNWEGNNITSCSGANVSVTVNLAQRQ
ncbi:hypothetical protein SNE35_28585 [Paucibacter sp. R3-3]|uniref:Uncharacterized protein n=1 Tax=Roseateles agri TaxID=3098619 RepID=A0ABU5DQ88_9BURK|nr:hypothetical protein [Paucibacter sp. R3-3]MDY0748491.1 hypothetical protein [Paucibacter sp. R3-3]